MAYDIIHYSPFVYIYGVGCVNIYIYIHICAHMLYTCVCKCMYIYIYICIYKQMYIIYICKYIYIHIYIYNVKIAIVHWSGLLFHGSVPGNRISSISYVSHGLTRCVGLERRDLPGPWEAAFQ